MTFSRRRPIVETASAWKCYPPWLSIKGDDDGGYEKEMDESLEDAYDDDVGRNGFYGGFYRSSDSCESQDSIIDDRPAPVFVSYDCYPSSLCSEEMFDIFDEHDKSTEKKVRLMLDQMHDDLYRENTGEDDEKSSLETHKTEEELSTEERHHQNLLRRHNFETHNQPQSNHTSVTATEWTDVFPHFQVVGKKINSDNSIAAERKVCHPEEYVVYDDKTKYNRHVSDEEDVIFGKLRSLLYRPQEDEDTYISSVPYSAEFENDLITEWKNF